MNNDKIKLNTVNLTTLKTMMEVFHNHRKSLYLWGKPSTAKSSIIRQFARRKADELGLKYSEDVFGEGYYTCKVITLSQMDSPDLRGMPVISVDKDGNEVTRFVPTEELPRVQGARGILFFDEMNNGDETTIKAAYQIVLEGAYGNLACLKIEDPNDPDFGKDAFWRVAASNTEDDFCNTTPLPLALLRRFSHVEVSPSSEEIIDYFVQSGKDSRVIAYLKENTTDFFPSEWNESLLMAKSNPFPSQWENISELITGLTHSVADVLLMGNIVTSCIGAGISGKFIAFVKTTGRINWDDIYTDTSKAFKSINSDKDKLSLTYAITTELAMRWKNKHKYTVGKKSYLVEDALIIAVSQELVPEMQIAFLRMLKTADERKFMTTLGKNKEALKILDALAKLMKN